MARKVDAEADAASKAILDQLQTKTVGPPPSSTGLTGDQLPETIFDINDFDQVKNQVTLQLSNLELLNVLNTIGQVTNTQSVSGPLPGTQEVVNYVKTDSGFSTIVEPGLNEVYQYQAGSVVSVSGGSGNITTEVSILDPDGNRVLIIDISSSGSSDYPVTETNFAPLYIAYPNKLQFKHEGTFTSVTSNFCTIRVR